MAKKKKERVYSFDEYMATFRPQVCRKCKGEGKLFEFGRPVYCDACNGTGRNDKKTVKALVAEAMRRVRDTRVTLNVE